jgi:hypothetical protein
VEKSLSMMDMAGNSSFSHTFRLYQRAQCLKIPGGALKRRKKKISPTTPGNPLANQPTSLGALVNCLMRAKNKTFYGPQEIAQSTKITPNKVKITSSNLYLFFCTDMLKKKKKPIYVHIGLPNPITCGARFSVQK